MKCLISKIIPFSCVDGPGSRLALFLQGCNLNCKNCHNPWTIGRCNHCAQCVPACQHNALTLVDGRVNWDASACQQCDTCLHLCPQQSTPMAQTLSVEEVLTHVRKAAMFIEGITVSGGEGTDHVPNDAVAVSGCAVQCAQIDAVASTLVLSGRQQRSA